MVEFLFSRRRDGAGHDGADGDLSCGAAQEESMRNVLPGAMVATLLWWLVDVLFGFTCVAFRYSVVYGGLASSDRLDHLDAAFRGDHFPGRRWNAELAESRKGAGPCVNKLFACSAIADIRQTSVH